MTRLYVGDVVGVDVVAFGMTWHHVGVIVGEDRRGVIYVVSKSRARGCVVEETLDEFTCGKAWKHHPHLWGDLSSDQVVDAAYDRIGEPWSPHANCEHFVREVHGLKSESPQLRETLALMGGGAAFGGLVLLPFAPALAAAAGVTGVASAAASRRRR